MSDDVPLTYDDCQTPPYAFDMLRQYLPPYARIWEPAAGEGYLAWAMATDARDYKVLATEVRGSQKEDFMTCWRPSEYLVTNPPYSRDLCERFIRRALELERPFAFLMRWRMMGTVWGWTVLREMQPEIIVPDIRINFKMPQAKWEGSGATFKACWFTHGLGLGRELTYVQLERREVLALEPYWYRSGV